MTTGNHRPRRKDGIDPVARSRARRRALQAVYAWHTAENTHQVEVSQCPHKFCFPFQLCFQGAAVVGWIIDVL